MSRLESLLIGFLLVAAANPAFTQTDRSDQTFDSMTQPLELTEECVAPRPPRDLAKTAYVRNGYRAILRILAAHHWQETGDCTCVIANLSWEEVVNKGAEFVTSEDPLRPFDTSELRLMADALEAERATACEKP